MPVIPEANVSVINAPDVVPRKPDASRAYVFSPDFCDRKTWWADAVKVTDETFVGDGLTTTFQLAHGTGSVANEAILDLTSGRVTDDQLMVAPGDSAPGGYHPALSVDGVAKTMRQQIEATGGDYSVNFDTGLVTFFVAPADQATISITYWYVPATAGPKLVARPPAGKKWSIDFAEAQLAKNFSLDDTILMNVFAGDGVTPLSQNVRYDRIGNLFDYSFGTFVEYPPLAGANGRGTTQASLVFRWNYLSPVVLYSSVAGGMTMIAWTEHKRALGGERATVVLYALEEDE